ncbi:MAG: P-loop NTPase [Polyangiaceae bacterium]|nr:P-loop NTPase [Polyangiaceae bacterium]
MSTATAPPGIADALRCPVIYVTGKGGVGKSTVAGAIAVAKARAGLRVALMEVDDDEAGKRALRGADAKVDHVVITFESSIEAAFAPIVGGALVARAVARQHAVRKLIRGMPATREFFSLEAVRTLKADGQHDVIVVDLPASGHAVDWLRVPGAFERFLAGGPLGALGRRVHDEVVARGRADVVIVALAEPLVIKETEQLSQRFLDEMGRRPSLVVVNRVASRDPEGALDAALRLAALFPDDPRPRELAGILRGRAERARDAFEALRLARGLDGVKVLAVPESAVDPSVLDVVRWLDLSAKVTA